MGNSNKKMALIASKGSLDFAYPPFILASTAAAMGFEVRIFFTFYGLVLLKKKLDPKVTIDGNPAVPLKIPYGPDFLQNHEIPIPKLISSNLPGFDEITTKLMKEKFKKKGVDTIINLRNHCVELGVIFYGCQMSMDVFDFTPKDFIDEVDVAGSATFLKYAADSNIQLFI